jgi:hypothetical protein
MIDAYSTYKYNPNSLTFIRNFGPTSCNFCQTAKLVYKAFRHIKLPKKNS